MPTRQKLSLEAPNILRFGECQTTIGPRPFVALARILATRHPPTVESVRRMVWGDRAICEAATAVLLHRINRKLAAVGCVLRVAVDCGRVVLV